MPGGSVARAWTLAALLVGTTCGGSGPANRDGAQGGPAGGDSGSLTTGGAAGNFDANGGAPITGGVGGAPATGGVGGNGGNGGGPGDFPFPGRCGRSGCAVNQYCLGCATADESGLCVALPQSCPATDGPVCACGGQIYPNECAAHAAGARLAPVGSCASPPAGYFRCGPRFCRQGTQYCQHRMLDSLDAIDTCVTLPPACAPQPACACLMQVACGPSCTNSGPDLTVTCPAR